MYELSAFLSKIQLNKSNVKNICIENSIVKISEVSSELFNYENLKIMMIELEYLYPINLISQYFTTSFMSVNFWTVYSLVSCLANCT